MNHFMARLIFCFFAEDTDIFGGTDLFTDTIGRMSERDSANTHEVIGEIFRAMNTEPGARKKAGIRRWADAFPYVNGGLFSKSTDVPPVQPNRAVVPPPHREPRLEEDQPRHLRLDDPSHRRRGRARCARHALHQRAEHPEGAQPAVLDDLREQLEEAGSNARKLLNLRNRMARIRVFDPACGSGNFWLSRTRKCGRSKRRSTRGEASRCAGRHSP